MPNTLWADRASHAYHVGILSLMAGLTLLVVPPGAVSPARAVLVFTALAGLLGETIGFAYATGVAFSAAAAVLCAVLVTRHRSARTALPEAEDLELLLAAPTLLLSPFVLVSALAGPPAPGLILAPAIVTVIAETARSGLLRERQPPGREDPG